MKKTEKGMPGYLKYKRTIEIIRTIVYFGIVIAILLLFVAPKLLVNILVSTIQAL